MFSLFLILVFLPQSVLLTLSVYQLEFITSKFMVPVVVIVKNPQLFVIQLERVAAVRKQFLFIKAILFVIPQIAPAQVDIFLVFYQSLIPVISLHTLVVKVNTRLVVHQGEDITAAVIHLLPLLDVHQVGVLQISVLELMIYIIESL